jgi:hypothetical protein
MSADPLPTPQLRLALEVIAYELQRRPEAYTRTDAISALEAVRTAAAALGGAGVPLRESYPRLVELAVWTLAALGALPEPSEVDGLSEFGGFDLWRHSRG